MAGAAVVAVDPSAWTVRGFDVRVDRPLVLGVINLTPDSFSDGGSYADTSNPTNTANCYRIRVELE